MAICWANVLHNHDISYNIVSYLSGCSLYLFGCAGITKIARHELAKLIDMTEYDTKQMPNIIYIPEMIIYVNKEIFNEIISIQPISEVVKCIGKQDMENFKNLFYSCCLFEQLECMIFLYDKGFVTIDDVRSDSNYILRRCSEYGILESIKVLCDVIGLDINDIRTYYNLAFRTAVENGHIDVIKYFCTKGLTVSDMCVDSNYALRVAAQNRNRDIVHFLCIEKGVDPSNILTRDMILSDVTDLNAREFIRIVLYENSKDRKL